jgi:hypothetical protein
MTVVSDVYLFDSYLTAGVRSPMTERATSKELTSRAIVARGVPLRGVLDSPWPELAVKALKAVRVCQLLGAVALMTSLGGVDLRAQVEISSTMTQVSLVARAPAHATIPGVSVQREIGLAEDHYQELVPGGSVTLPGGRHGSSEREVRYLTDGSSLLGEAPVRFELVIDPAI